MGLFELLQHIKTQKSISTKVTDATPDHLIMSAHDILHWYLIQEDNHWLQAYADNVRQKRVGNTVHLRALLEISNYCKRNCLYCGLSTSSQPVSRYRMSKEEILEAVQQAAMADYHTVVIQAGEDPSFSKSFLVDIVATIKKQWPHMAITLSLGELPFTWYTELYAAGADRYLLRFETADSSLFDKLHPHQPTHWHNRLKTLTHLYRMPFEIGSGIMVGIPGQSYHDLIQAILTFVDLDLDMIGIGPYIKNPDTELAKREQEFMLEEQNQVPATNKMVQTVLALCRILCPTTNIPVTSAIATLDPKHGRQHTLNWGANVIMPNFTPLQYRKYYEIYPYKAGYDVSPLDMHHQITALLQSMQRPVATHCGDSPHFQNRKQHQEVNL